jgi:hypothetical protein
VKVYPPNSKDQSLELNFASRELWPVAPYFNLQWPQIGRKDQYCGRQYMTEKIISAYLFDTIIKTNYHNGTIMNKIRRSLISRTLALLGILPLISISKSLANSSCPQKLKIDASNVLDNLLDLSSKTGKRLNYFPNALDAKDQKSYLKGSICGKCKFYNIDKSEQSHAPCSIAGNKFVSACGWCKTYKLDNKKA